jgi:pimeloyl-ACP methyl ester carboxylesterase
MLFFTKKVTDQLYPIKNSSNTQWVTFVHGAGGSSSIWFKQIRDFQKHYNVLLLDLRGHGKSQSMIKLLSSNVIIFQI